MSTRLQEAIKLFDIGLEEQIKKCVISDEKELMTIDFPKARQYEYVLFHLLSPLGFTPSQIEIMAKDDGMRTGREWESVSHAALIDRGRLLVYRKMERRSPMVVPEEGKYVFTQEVSISFKMVVKDDIFQFSNSPDTVCLDADKVVFPLTIRYAEEGDRFIPLGMNGSKLVSDYLTDRKKSLYDKRRQLVVTDSRGEILWLVGERIAHPYRIVGETKRVLTVVYKHGKT